MNPGGGRRSRRTSSTGGGALANPAVRGGLLIAVAIVIGIVLLQVIDDGTGPIGDGGTTTTTAIVTTTSRASTSTTRSSTSTTRKTTGTTRPNAQVTVLVQNGSGVAGAAASMTARIRAAGYQTLTPATAAATVTGTTVYYAPGYNRECATVATIVGPGAKGAAMPTPTPTGAERANCLVVLGA